MRTIKVEVYHRRITPDYVWYDLVAKVKLDTPCHWVSDEFLDEAVSLTSTHPGHSGTKRWWYNPEVEMVNGVDGIGTAWPTYKPTNTKNGDVVVLSSMCEEHGIERRAFRLIHKKGSKLGSPYGGIWEHCSPGEYNVWEDRFRHGSESSRVPQNRDL